MKTRAQKLGRSFWDGRPSFLGRKIFYFWDARVFLGDGAIIFGGRGNFLGGRRHELLGRSSSVLGRNSFYFAFCYLIGTFLGGRNTPSSYGAQFVLGRTFDFLGRTQRFFGTDVDMFWDGRALYLNCHRFNFWDGLPQ